MNFTLIICTFRRVHSLQNLLGSLKLQVLFPDEIIVIDGSPDDETKEMLTNSGIKNLRYFKTSAEQRGLTKQRNIGISKVNSFSEIVCFLDDDTVLKPDYFQEILKTYTLFPEALGVGGYISNEINWELIGENYIISNNDFVYDGWKRQEGKRFVWRKKFGLDSNCPPGFSPQFSHGRSIGFLPPSGKIYPAEQLMGGVSSFRKSVFQSHQFSDYFEGYGLYEDADFCIRVAKTGDLLVNTAALLEHHHDSAGRPNKYVYGKMVVRNGWYVWRIKNPQPKFRDKIKWNSITILLMFVKLTNVLNTSGRREAFTESCGRLIGWLSLIYNKPKVKL